MYQKCSSEGKFVKPKTQRKKKNSKVEFRFFVMPYTKPGLN